MSENKIILKVNGKPVEISAGSTIGDFIVEREVTGNMYVIEKNLQIVQKQDYNMTKLSDGDVVEIVGFFGGG